MTCQTNTEQLATAETIPPPAPLPLRARLLEVVRQLSTLRPEIEALPTPATHTASGRLHRIGTTSAWTLERAMDQLLGLAERCTLDANGLPKLTATADEWDEIHAAVRQLDTVTPADAFALTGDSGVYDVATSQKAR